MRRIPETLETKSPLKACYVAGSSQTLVVSFSGVGDVYEEDPPFEFLGSAHQNGANHVLMISDPLRCWLNHSDYIGDIQRLIHSVIEAHGLTRIVTLGNSMGGFMAIRLAEFFPIATVIAFSPQFSLNNRIVPEEKRWSEFRENISDWIFEDVGRMEEPNTKYYVFHGEKYVERIHWSRFPQTSNLHHYILTKTSHNLAQRLKDNGGLSQVIGAAVKNRPKTVRRLLERHLGENRNVYYRADWVPSFA